MTNRVWVLHSKSSLQALLIQYASLSRSCGLRWMHSHSFTLSLSVMLANASRPCSNWMRHSSLSDRNKQEKYLHCHFTKCLKILTKDEILFLFEVGLLRHKKAMNWTEVNLHRKVAKGYSFFWSLWNRWGHSVRWRGKREVWEMERERLKQWGCRRMTAALIVTLQSLYTTKNFQWIEKRCWNYQVRFWSPVSDLQLEALVLHSAALVNVTSEY